jgi:hypothetical protein
MIKASSQNALERYFKKIGEDIYLNQQAFSEVRQKLKREALRELFEITVDVPYQRELNDHRLKAVGFLATESRIGAKAP